MSIEAFTPADLASLLDGEPAGEAEEALAGLLGDEWEEVYPPAARAELRARLDAAGWPDPFARCPTCQTVFLRRFRPESGRCRECAARLDPRPRRVLPDEAPAPLVTRTWGEAPPTATPTWTLAEDRGPRRITCEEGLDFLEQRQEELRELAARTEAADWLGGGGPDPSDEVPALPSGVPSSPALQGRAITSYADISSAESLSPAGVGRATADADSSAESAASLADPQSLLSTSPSSTSLASAAPPAATPASSGGEAALTGEPSEALVPETPDAEVLPAASREDEPASRGDAPASREDEPASREDEPAPREDEPAPREDEPVSRGDEPASRGDEPAPREDEPASRGDEPAPRELEPAPREAGESRGEDSVGDAAPEPVSGLEHAGGQAPALTLAGQPLTSSSAAASAEGPPDQAKSPLAGAGPAELREETGRRAGRVHTLALGSSFRIGTARRGEVVLRQRGVAFKHAEVEVAEDGSATLTDLGAGQTWLGDELLVANEVRELSSGDRIRCGEANLTVTLQRAKAPPAAPPAAAPPAPVAPCDPQAPWHPPSAAEVAAARHTPPSQILAALPASQLDLVARAARAIPLPRWRAAQPRSERTFVDHDAEAFAQLARSVLNGRYLPDDAGAWLRWEEDEDSFLCRSALEDGATVILAPWDLLARLPEPLPGSGPARVGRFLELLLPRSTGRLVAEEESELAGGFWRCRYASRAGLCAGRFSSIEARSNGHVLTATLTPRFPLQTAPPSFAEDPVDLATGDLRHRPAWRPPPRGQGAPAPHVPRGGRQRERRQPSRSRARDHYR